MDRLEGKTALITGGTSGIGQSCCELFASEGATVIFIGRNRDRGEEIQNKICSAGGKAKFYPCDVVSKAEIIQLNDIIRKDYEKLDILVNNAGLLMTASLEEITDENWDLMFDTNLKAVMHICQTFMDMLVSSKGVLLNNASINGLHHYIKGKRSYMYAAVKSALIQFTNYIAKNYAPDVRANVLCPGITKTNLFTNRDFSRFDDCNLLGRIAEPQEIANVALFLCSDDASFITGATIVADGGETIK